MKKITFMLFSMLAVLTGFSSCSNDDNNETMTNYASVVVEGNSIINEDDDQTVTVAVMLAYAPKTNVTVTFSLQNNDGEVASIQNEATVTIPAGYKTQSITIKSNNKHLLSVPRVLTVNTTYSDPNIKTDGKACTLTINPDSDIPELTADQLKLIEGYKEKYNIDLTKILGKVSVSTLVTFNDDDKADINDNNDTRSFSGTTIITLSDKATADKPVLKMVSNAMGMAAFNYEMLRKKTVEDNEYFTQTPYGAAVMSAINYDYSKETFTMTLDGIEVNPTDMTLSFTGTKTYMDEEINTVPFDYTFSAWSRLKAMADEGKSLVVDNGDGGKSTESVQTIIDGGGTINPSAYFDNVDYIADGEETSYPNIYVQPAGKIDFAGGKMTFAFPWYLDNTNGCQRVEATYSFGK